MKISEVLGYINTNFVEHNNIKVIIIGDVAKIKDNEEMKLISEKLIGRTIKFSYNYDEIIDVVLNNYNSCLDFVPFIKKHSNFIKYLLEQYKTTNLRTIFFFTDLIHRYFSEKNDIDNDTWEKIILFTLVLSIEFRRNEFLTNELEKKKELMELSNTFFLLDSIRSMSDKNDDSNLSFTARISQQYFKNQIGRYHFYDSIYTHIIKGYLNVEKFIAEFTPSKSDKYMNPLDLLNDYLVLSNSEIKNSVDVIFEGLKNGVYNLYHYEVIFRKLLLLSEDGIITQSKEELKNLVFNSIEISKSRENDFNLAGMDQYGFYTESSSPDTDIILKIEEIHNCHFENKKKDLVNSIITKLTDEKSSFSDILHSFLGVRLSNFLDADKILDNFSLATHYSLTKFFRFLNEKYRYDHYETNDDIELIKQLKNGIIVLLADIQIEQHQKAVLNNGLRILNKIIVEFDKKRDN